MQTARQLPVVQVDRCFCCSWVTYSLYARHRIYGLTRCTGDGEKKGNGSQHLSMTRQQACQHNEVRTGVATISTPQERRKTLSLHPGYQQELLPRVTSHDK